MRKMELFEAVKRKCLPDNLSTLQWVRLMFPNPSNQADFEDGYCTHGTVIRNQVHSLKPITHKALKRSFQSSALRLSASSIRRMALLHRSTVISIETFYAKISSLVNTRYWMMPISVETVIGNKPPICDSD